MPAGIGCIVHSYDIAGRGVVLYTGQHGLYSRYIDIAGRQTYSQSTQLVAQVEGQQLEGLYASQHRLYSRYAARLHIRSYSSVGRGLVARGVMCRPARAIQQLDIQMRVGGRHIAIQCIAIVAQVRGQQLEGLYASRHRLYSSQTYRYGQAVDVRLRIHSYSSVGRGLVARGVICQPAQAIQQAGSYRQIVDI